MLSIKKASVAVKSPKRLGFAQLAPRATSTNGSSAAAAPALSHLEEMNQAIGRAIKRAAAASSATHLARINVEIGHQIKIAAAAAAAGKLRPAGPKKTEEEPPKAKKVAK